MSKSRSRFICNQSFYEIRSELEKTIIDALRKYLESIRLVFSDNLKKVAKITNLFNPHFSSIMLLHYHIEDVAENILTFIKETYYFRCISWKIHFHDGTRNNTKRIHSYLRGNVGTW